MQVPGLYCVARVLKADAEKMVEKANAIDRVSTFKYQKRTYVPDAPQRDTVCHIPAFTSIIYQKI